MKWIDAGDIKIWAEGKPRHCQQTLPELVSRLILAHASNTIRTFHFPRGDSVATPGWDGRLDTPVISPFFPSGVSGWEIGTDKSAQAKAESEYKKRTNDPLGLAINETTFVFVTPRSWPGRIKWENDKRATGVWKDVRVINIDQLVQWLDSTPGTALWLAREIGKVVSGGIRDLEGFWAEWSVGTQPIMTPELVISGRERDVEAIQKWLLGLPAVLEVQGDHPDEAFAFLYATIAALPETARVQALSRCVMAETVQELRQLTQAFKNQPLIIVVPGECVGLAPYAASQGHHVFVSMDAKAIGLKEILRLSRPQLATVEQLLHGGGLSEADSQRLARDSGRSIPVLRRHLFQSSAVNAPAWASVESARVLIPALLAGAWNEEKNGDRQLIETLSGMAYALFIKELTPFLTIDDSPIRKIGNVWKLKSPLDSWFLLANHLTDDVLKVFQKCILAVLTATDPKYDLPAEDRWAAAIHGKSSQYSEWLRMGLVESLVLLAVYGNRAQHVTSAESFSSNVVRDVFAVADKWEVWSSLKDVTALLGEAAPDVFMETVEQSLTKNPKILQELMQDDAGLFGECRHSGLLWALEGIAWSSEYFSRAVLLLAALANVDSGGRWMNRAINSLGDIFLPGLPQTYASVEERLSALDILIAKYPKMVWEFGQGYYRGGHISESHRFQWRYAGGTRRGLEREDPESDQKYGAGLLLKLTALATSRVNLTSTIDEFINLPPIIQEDVLKTLEKMDTALFSKEERAEILSGIREALNWINSYGDEEKKKWIPGLEIVLKKMIPEDVIERVGWLLTTPWPQLPQGHPKEYDDKDSAVKKAQQEAAREILDKTTLDKIFEFASTMQYPGILANNLGKAVKDDEEDVAILDGMIAQTTNRNWALLIRGYTDGRVAIVGPEWVDHQIQRMKTKGNYSSAVCALLYLGLPESSSTWSAVSVHGEEVEKAYWKQASGYSRLSRDGDAPIAVEKLLDAERPDAALQIAGDPSVSIPSRLLQRLLRDILSMQDGNRRAGASDDYHIGRVFNQLYEQNELTLEELARLEFPFAVLFEELKRYISTPMAIHRLLQKDPLFFSQLVSLIYKRDDGTSDPVPKELDEKTLEKRAIAAHKVLDSWRTMPGLKVDGTLDENELSKWVEDVRRYCSENNHVTGGDLQLAFMLAHAPADTDGYWPHIAVRNLIEHLNNGLIDRHIEIGIYNSRGVVSRSPGAGGQQERDLVEKYKKMSDALRAKWPRTAAILRSIARSYEEDAKRHDIDSDLRDLR